MMYISKLTKSKTSDPEKWAECFVNTLREEDWKTGDIDNALMIGWFANYWAAVNDPLADQIETLQSQLQAFADNKDLLTKYVIEDMEFIQRISRLVSDAQEQFDKRQKLLTAIESLQQPESEKQKDEVRI